MQGRSRRGGSQGESHLFASEKLFHSTCDLREKAPKSRCHAEYERREAAPASHARSHGRRLRKTLVPACLLRPPRASGNTDAITNTIKHTHLGPGPPPADVRIAKSF